MVTFSPLLDMLADIPDPRRAGGKLYKLPHVLLFSILAIGSGSNSYRGVERRRSPDIVTFIDVHRARLNGAFGLTWRRAPAHTATRHTLQGLDPAAVEAVFRRYAAQLQAAQLQAAQLYAACTTSGQTSSVALDGKTLLTVAHSRTGSVFGAAGELANTLWQSCVAAVMQVECAVLTRISATGLLRKTAERAFYVCSVSLAAERRLGHPCALEHRKHVALRPRRDPG